MSEVTLAGVCFRLLGFHADIAFVITLVIRSAAGESNRHNEQECNYIFHALIIHYNAMTDLQFIAQRPLVGLINSNINLYFALYLVLASSSLIAFLYYTPNGFRLY